MIQKLQHVSQNLKICVNSAYVNLKLLLKTKLYNFINNDSNNAFLFTLKKFNKVHV